MRGNIFIKESNYREGFASLKNFTPLLTRRGVRGEVVLAPIAYRRLENHSLPILSPQCYNYHSIGGEYGTEP